MKASTIFFFTFLFLSSCLIDDNIQPDNSPFDYEFPSEFNFNEGLLLRLDSAIRLGEFGDINSLLVIKNDKIIFENYYRGAQRSTLYDISNVAMSITSSLIGTALNENLIPNLQTPIQQTLSPQYDSIFKAAPGKRSINFEHLLTMKSGLAWNESIIPYPFPENNLVQLTNSNDWALFLLNQPLEAEPGRRFAFNSAANLIISSVIQNQTNQPFENYITQNLFKPLQINDFQIESDPSGLTNSAFGIKMNTLDLAKISYMFLKKGNWFGAEIIPFEYLEEATAVQVSITNTNSYGYHWWRYTDSYVEQIFPSLLVNDVYFTYGFDGQAIFIIPHLEMTFTVMAENLNNGDFFQTQFLIRNFLSSLNQAGI